jgi:hypothetical protein
LPFLSLKQYEKMVCIIVSDYQQMVNAKRPEVEEYKNTQNKRALIEDFC